MSKSGLLNLSTGRDFSDLEARRLSPDQRQSALRSTWIQYQPAASAESVDLTVAQMPKMPFRQEAAYFLNSLAGTRIMTSRLFLEKCPIEVMHEFAPWIRERTMLTNFFHWIEARPFGLVSDHFTLVEHSYRRDPEGEFVRGNKEHVKESVSEGFSKGGRLTRDEALKCIERKEAEWFESGFYPVKTAPTVFRKLCIRER